MPKVVGITRVRNESLIIEDTLRHVLEHVDHVILYDDCSTDETVDIAARFDGVTIIRGDEWRADRPSEETRHRALLLERAKGIGADWCWCFDADERIVGGLPALKGDAYRFRLFDGYITEEHSAPYVGGKLEELPRAWGPECRDIVMFFRPECAVYFGRDRREPKIYGTIQTAQTLVKHYGKSLSVEHWEETCDYYAGHWPEPYKSKWAARRGKAIHTVSDFGRKLLSWEGVAENAVRC